jgi:hypothetical protein
MMQTNVGGEIEVGPVRDSEVTAIEEAAIEEVKIEVGPLSDPEVTAIEGAAMEVGPVSDPEVTAIDLDTVGATCLQVEVIHVVKITSGRG